MPKRLRVLVACEESQEVTKAFRKKGHTAFSCDIQDCSGGYPQWHIKGDAMREVIKSNLHTSNYGGNGTNKKGSQESRRLLLSSFLKCGIIVIVQKTLSV